MGQLHLRTRSRADAIKQLVVGAGQKHFKLCVKVEREDINSKSIPQLSDGGEQVRAD